MDANEIGKISTATRRSVSRAELSHRCLIMSHVPR